MLSLSASFSFLTSVLNCVVAVPLSDKRLLAHSKWPAVDATIVHLSLPSWSYNTLKQGVGIDLFNIDIDLIMLLLYLEPPLPVTLGEVLDWMGGESC